MVKPAGVHHHILLERRGGAAKVARALIRHQSSVMKASLSYEVAEPGANSERVENFPCLPGDLAQLAPPESIVHVHATRDWPALLSGFATAPRPLVVTVHDCSLITGGCVYPVFCSSYASGCPDPCPREYPNACAYRATKKELTAAARPVLVSPSSWLAGMLRSEWPDLSVKVIPNGVDIPAGLADKVEARARLGISPAARVALFLAHGGVRAAYKGGDRFEALWERILGLVPGTVGIIAGGDEISRRDGLLFFPYIEGESLSFLLRASDILVYPSLADNHPLVVLEAMAHGLPVAAYSAGGIPEQILDGESGRVLPVLDEEGLARAAAGILVDQSLARVLGKNARARAERFFSAARMAKDYGKVYERAWA